MKKKLNKKRGFGLLEVLLSSLIIIAILSALVLIGRAAMANNEYLQERAQAIYLAQEGIEFTRQIRDTNWIDNLNTTQWDTLTGSGIVTTGCYSLPNSISGRAFLLSGTSVGAGSTSVQTENCAGQTKQDITVNSVTYNRKIFIDHTFSGSTVMPNPSGSPDLKNYAVTVTAIVRWTFNGTPKDVRLTEILTNWRPDY